MKLVTSYTKDEYEKQSVAFLMLLANTSGLTIDQMFSDFKRINGYAHYGFSGFVTPLLIQRLERMPTPEEIIMIVDNGFSHFGATCTINGNYFSGKVCTD